ncbi:MAG: hypothetical protein U5K84_13325 [Alkalibacterium sp.]|nr:hypothetical protein [Alkalibacterium sp.]
MEDAVVSVINMQQVGEDPFGWYEGSQETGEEDLQQVGTGSGSCLQSRRGYCLYLHE